MAASESCSGLSEENALVEEKAAGTRMTLTHAIHGK
jgi:hypothetical protein